MKKNSEHPLALPIGTELVGDYVITKVLGSGGFGITYEANERSLDRTVAIKEFFPVDIVEREGWALVKARSNTLEIKYARGLRRFIEEAKAITQFNHPNIVRVLRYFKTNNTAFMVLHYEEGVDMGLWRERMKRPPTEKQLLGIIAPLLDALELIHENDFLHRDIAPDNIIIRKDGSPILIDFGSARSDLTFNSKTVSALVKSGYSPFEQYAKNSKEQGPWTDIYSFGATLYQMVTGEAPPDSLSRLAVDEIIPVIRRSKKYYSREFLAAIDTALAIQITDRPQSIDEWRSILLPKDDAHQPVNLSLQKRRKSTGNSRFSRPKTRHKPSIVGGVLQNIGPSPVSDLIKKAGLKTVDFGENAAKLAARMKAPLLKLVPRKRPPNLQKRHPANAASLPHQGADNLTPGAPPELANPRSLRSLLNELDDRYKDTEHEQAIEKAARQPVLEAPVKGKPNQAPLAAKRRRFWHKMSQKFNQASQPKLFSKRFITSLLLLGGFIGGIIALRPELTNIADKIDLPKIITAPRTLFAFGHPALIKAYAAHSGGVNFLRLTADGQQLISVGADRMIKIWDPKNGAFVRSYKAHSQNITAFDVHNGQLVQGDSTGNVSLFDLVNNEQLASFPAWDRAIRSVAFVGRGSDVITGADRGQLDYWEFKNGQYIRRDINGQAHSKAILAIVSHRRFFVSASADHTAKIWRRSKRKRLIRTYRRHTAPVSALALSPKAYRLATGSDDGTIKIWSPRSRRLRRTLKKKQATRQGAILSLAFTQNGKWLASGGADDTINIWNARNGRLIQSYQNPGGAVRALLFSTNGKRLITASKDGKIRFWDWNARRKQK